MEYFGTGFDPLLSMGNNLARVKTLPNADKEEVTKEFATLFYAEILKQVFESRSGIFSSEEKGNYFGNLGMYSNIYYEKFAKELVDKGGIDNLVSANIFGAENRVR